MLFVQDAFAQSANQAQQGSTTVSLVMMFAIFIVMWFLLIAPQKKRVKQHQLMISQLKRGDEVITQGGLMGRITELHEHAVEVELAPGQIVAVQRQYIAQVLPKGSVPKIGSASKKNQKKNNQNAQQNTRKDEDVQEAVSVDEADE